MRENCIEWIEGDSRITITTYHRKFINKLKAISEENPEEVQIIKENQDGSICAHVSLACLKIHAKRKLSEEQKQEIRNRFAKSKEAKCGETP